MCTLTLLSIPSPDGPTLRLAFNRDESRRRAPAIPPRRFTAGQRTILMPIDPESTGAWIALSDAGIALAVMNLNPLHPPKSTPHQSRGAIIPALLHADSLEQMRDAATQLPFNEFAPFRLLLVSREEVTTFEHLGSTPHITTQPLHAPLLFTSSGLGDHLVETPRRHLFNTLLASNPTPSTQDAFHRHTWPDRPHLSICMSRSDARTVSQTLLHLTPTHAHMTYFPDSPNQPLHPQTLSLSLSQPEPACT